MSESPLPSPPPVICFPPGWHVCLTISTTCGCLSVQLCPCQHFLSLFLWITFNICPLMIGCGYKPLLGASFTSLSGAELALWPALILTVLVLPTSALPSRQSGLIAIPSLVAMIVALAICPPCSWSYEMCTLGACKQKSLLPNTFTQASIKSPAWWKSYVLHSISVAVWNLL